MARRITTGSDRLYRNASVFSSIAPYTIVFSAKPYSTSGNYTLFSINDNVSFADYDRMRIRFGFLGLSIDGSDDLAGSISTGSYINFALRRNSSSSIQGLINGSVITSNTTDVSGREPASTSTRIDFGGHTSDNTDTGDATFSNIKIWTAALSDGEIALEYDSVCPVRTANIWAWYPVLSDGTRDQDFSGNSRDLSESGSLSDEAPPVSLNLSTTCGGSINSIDRGGRNRGILRGVYRG